MPTSNILDKVSLTLPVLIWDHPESATPKLKPQHAKWIVSQIHKVLESGGYSNPSEWLDLYLTGSLTTYQFSDSSDCDVSIFIKSDRLPGWSRAEMIALMIDHLDGTRLPGTPYEMQDFVVAPKIKPADIYRKGLRSGYDILRNIWVNPPDPELIHNVEAEENGYYVAALESADKMEHLLRYEPAKAITFWKQIHHRRMRDQTDGKGDASAANLVYKFLAQRGLFPKLEEATGTHIANQEENRWSLTPNIYMMQRGVTSMAKSSSLRDRWNDPQRRIRELQAWAHKHNESPEIISKNGSPKQVAKWVYHAPSNHIVVGQMGNEEGENPSHAQLAPMLGDINPRELTFGQVSQNGYGETFLRPQLSIGPKGEEMNPYQQQYQTEEAVRRAIPGTIFPNARERLKPEWGIEDPKIQYAGVPPTLGQNSDPEPSEFDFS